jgi:hypothetical protein
MIVTTHHAALWLAAIMLCHSAPGALAAPVMPAADEQASAACAGAPANCVVSSSDQLSLAAGQTISRTLPCPEVAPMLFESAYTTSNPAVIVTRAATEGGQGATFTALNRTNALTFVTFYAGCIP